MRPKRLRQALKERLAKFGLEVATDKTKTLRFGSQWRAAQRAV